MLLFLGAGAFYDVKEHRIPNWWVLIGIINGILIGILESENSVGGMVFLEVPIRFFLRFSVVTAVFFVFFVCRMIGAGDIKLAALICGYLGLKAGAAAVGSGFLIGAFWSLIKMTVKGSLLKRLSFLLAYIRRVFQTGKIAAYYNPARDGYEGVIPLGMCLFLGTIVSIIFW